jgi:hypothetical protein
LQDGAGVLAQQIAGDGDGTQRGGAIFQQRHPILWQWAFFETGDGFHVIGPRADGERLDTGPPGVAKALDAGLGRSKQLHGRQVGGTEVKGFQALLSEHEGDGFRMSDGGVAGNDDVDGGRDEATGVALKDRSSEGAAGLVKDILAGEFDDELHSARASGEGVFGLLFDKGGQPVGQVKDDLVGGGHSLRGRAAFNQGDKAELGDQMNLPQSLLPLLCGGVVDAFSKGIQHLLAILE